ncbi:MAG: quinolinate synthase NadA [Rickettsiales bacterium]
MIHSYAPAFGEESPESQIARLREERNAVILSHYYQEDAIQDMADFVGDSLDLSRKAASTNAEMIVFCGVRFMADVAKILNPTKKVLLPDMRAGCSLEESCPPDAFRAFVDARPGHKVLTYINSSAEVKGMSDIIVTSSNAEKIIRSLPENEPIIFGPDKYLGAYLNKITGRRMVLWPGSCVVHERFSEKELVKLQATHPRALVVAHPECPEYLLGRADFIGSTSKLISFCADRDGGEFIVLTEPGIIHAMQKAAPRSLFLPAPGIGDVACASCNTCPYMRLNTVEKLRDCLRDETPQITLTQEEIQKARAPLMKMLEMSA